MQNKFLSIALKLICLVFVLYLLMFYLRLGWFMEIMMGVGLLLAVWTTKQEWNKSAHQSSMIFFITFLYIILNGIVWRVFLDQKSYKSFFMEWTDKGSQNDFKESEVVLRFIDYPQQYIGIFSNKLSNYLRTRGGNPVNVEFEVTSDFGCIRGVKETRIGGLQWWESGYSGATGRPLQNTPKGQKEKEVPDPWLDPWWCP